MCLSLLLALIDPILSHARAYTYPYRIPDYLQESIHKFGVTSHWIVSRAPKVFLNSVVVSFGATVATACLVPLLLPLPVPSLTRNAARSLSLHSGFHVMVGSHWSATARSQPFSLPTASRARVFHRKTDLRGSKLHSGAKRLLVEGSVFDECLQSFCCSLGRRKKGACVGNMRA